MKKYVYVLIIISLMSGCVQPRYLHYSSTGDIEHKSVDIRTEMKFINNIKNDPFSFGLISAIDYKNAKTYPYLLFAQKYSDLETGLESCMLGYATTLPPKQANELLSAVDKTLLEWDNIQDKTSGIFCEFISAPIDQTYENNKVDVWVPSLKFMFNQTKSGSYALLYLGERKVDGRMLPVRYKFGKNGLIRFRELLQAGIDDMNKKTN